MRKSIYAGLLLLGAGALGGCQADMDTPALETPVATLEANTSILDLKTAYEGKSEVVGFKPGTDAEHIVIKGRVVSSDASGNIYKSLVIQDETAALAFSLNQSSMYVDYRLGQEVLVDMTGLNIGYYRGLQQVGAPGEPYNGTPQLGFMSYDYWLRHSQMNGLPDPACDYVRVGDALSPDRMHCFVFNSFDELNGQLLTTMQSQLVEFRNVSFLGAGELNYSDYQESANRTLVDANGQELTVRNSGYSNFYNEILPKGRGRVRGILSYYGDSWQLVLRGLSDVMITEDGTREKPFTVAQALDLDNQGLAGWVTGYIVGSVKAGESNVTSADQVIFGAEADIDNNLLVAASPDEKDIANCIAVELPQGTMLRKYGNLLDNPGVYGRKISVSATIDRFLGMIGLRNCAGNADSFEIEGVEPGGAPAASGSGTETDPYNIGFVLRSAAGEDIRDVWVEGYVAGYVAQGDFAAGAYFGADEVTGSTNYLNQTNVILSEVASGCDIYNSAPAQLAAASRPVLGLKDNPGVFGKRVRVKCRITDWLGSRAIRNITEVKVMD